jgi:anti-anti-sigma factor
MFVSEEGASQLIETEIRNNDTIYLRPLSDLDWVNALSLRHAVHEMLQPRQRVLIDLSHVNYIDAAGIRTLVGSIRRVRAVGGEVELSNPCLSVGRRLTLAGIYGLLLPPLEGVETWRERRRV